MAILFCRRAALTIQFDSNQQVWAPAPPKDALEVSTLLPSYFLIAVGGRDCHCKINLNKGPSLAIPAAIHSSAQGLLGPRLVSANNF